MIDISLLEAPKDSVGAPNSIAGVVESLPGAFAGPCFGRGLDRIPSPSPASCGAPAPALSAPSPPLPSLFCPAPLS